MLSYIVGRMRLLRRETKTIPTHRLCTLVSIAIRFGLIEFGFPGNPYGIAKLTLLLSEN